MSAGNARIRSVISGWGHALPKAQVSTDALEATHGLPAGSLSAATGVQSRYVASRKAEESQVALGLAAARVALERADVGADSLDLIIAASAVPQQLIPGTAPLYQRGLGLGDGRCQVMDVNTTCLSALSALDIAASFLESGRAQRVLIVSSELASCALPWKTDPEVAALFGDGAAAWVVHLFPLPGPLKIAAWSEPPLLVFPQPMKPANSPSAAPPTVPTTTRKPSSKLRFSR